MGIRSFFKRKIEKIQKNIENEILRNVKIKNINRVIEDAFVGLLNNPNIVNPDNSPNGFDKITHIDYLSYNIKWIMSKLAVDRLKELSSPNNEPIKVGLTSKIATQEDLESGWARYWLSKLKLNLEYHRKQWEYAFVLQTLYENNMFGKKGLGLACGTEIIPSFLVSVGCIITAGDKPFEKEDSYQVEWNSSAQWTQSKESLYYENLCSRKLFDENLTIKYIDMNSLPQDQNNEYDFCWSICAIEHIGSIKAGINFLKNSLNLLKRGGISIHTTEYNLFSESKTIDNCGAVIFTKEHFDYLSDEIKKHGGELVQFNSDIGNGIFDHYIDMPPYEHQPVPGIKRVLARPDCCPHIKMLLNGFPSTCAGLIIKKL